MSIEVNPYVSELRHAVNVAALNYDIWWVYKDVETRPKFTATMNRYNLFFQSSIHAHFVALLVALYGLYETRSDTYNLPTLLKILREDALVPEPVLNELECLFSRAKPLWVKVSILRNKAFGHRSKAHTIAEIFKEAAVTPNELRDLVAVTKEVLNGISHSVCKEVHAFNLDAREATINMLNDLKKVYESH